MIDTLYILPLFAVLSLIVLCIDFYCKKGIVYLSYILFVLMGLLFFMIQSELFPLKKTSDIQKVQIIKGGEDVTAK